MTLTGCLIVLAIAWPTGAVFVLAFMHQATKHVHITHQEGPLS